MKINLTYAFSYAMCNVATTIVSLIDHKCVSVVTTLLPFIVFPHGLPPSILPVAVRLPFL